MKNTRNVKIAYTVFEWLDSIVFSLSLVLILFTFVLKTYTVQGSSMQPQFKTGDYVIAYGLFYQPRQGDVVIIDDNNSLGEPLIKRVIATEGETVDVDRVTGAVMVDGEPFPDVVSAGSDNLRGDVKYPCIVPKGCIFVMGDNRSVSLDSRFGALGFVDTRSVVGKEVLVFGK